LADGSDVFDTLGLLLALIKGEPLTPSAHLDTLSNMMENLRSDSREGKEQIVIYDRDNVLQF